MIGAWVTGLAEAAMRDVCVGAEPEYSDADYAAALRYDVDDFLNDNDAIYPLNGVKIEVVGVATKFAGSDGCASFSVNTSTLYQIKATSIAEVDVGDVLLGMATQTVRVRDDDDTPAPAIVSWSNWDPPETAVETHRNVTSGGRAWNVLLAATFALGRLDNLTVLGDQTWDFYLESECAANATCYDPSQDATYVDNDYKVGVVSALGQNMVQRALPFPDVNQDEGAAKGGCHSTSDPAHELQQKEFSSQAFWDGVGVFFAALAFNDLTGETDCFVHYGIQEDWDLDNDVDPYAVNCAGVPWEDAAGGLLHGADTTNDPSIGDNDYYGDVTIDLDCDPSGTDTHRGTAYDWLRLLRDLSQDESFTWNIVLDAVANLEDPDTWADDDDVFFKLDAAFTAIDYFGFGWAADWEELGEHHGVDR